jgi:hypothetical protein
MSIRQILGALARDGVRFERHVRGRWERIHNRRETISLAPEGRGVRCDWQWTSVIDYCRFVPGSGARLMRRALADWPILSAELPRVSGTPEVTFLIGHRGSARLPLLEATLRTVAAQYEVAIECVVVEQSAVSELSLPEWVRVIHQPVGADTPYNRSATFNLGAKHARGRILILHDNDMLVPAGYAAEVVRHVASGLDAMDLKRMIFYLTEKGVLDEVVQNLRGASIAITREGFDAIGGFDERFVGWGGEDVEFWERAETLRASTFGYLPLIHLWHAPQPEKLLSNDAPAVRRYLDETATVPVAERIARLQDSRR